MANLVGRSAVVAAGAKNLGGLISTTLAEKGVNVAVHYNSAATEPDADKTVAAVTPFFYGEETPERVAFHKSQAMSNRLTRIEDIAPLVLFLADEGHWVTRQTIFANGGYTTR